MAEPAYIRRLRVVRETGPAREDRPHDELTQRIRDLEAERLRPVPPPPAPRIDDLVDAIATGGRGYYPTDPDEPAEEASP